MQTFQPVYGIIIIYATSEAVVTDCVSIVQPALVHRQTLRRRKEPVSCGQKAFQSDKNLCQHFLPGSERPELRAVSLFLKGEVEFNGTALPLHLPTRI